MNKCIDKRLGDRLYAYEIDLLSTEEREEFEIHLLECKYCNDRVLEFQPSAEIIENDEEIKDVVTRLDTNKNHSNKHFGTYLKSALAVAAIIVILLVKPWEIEFHSTKDAMALANRIAVLYFENLAIADDPERTGEIITDLLITDLSQSEYIQVLSYQRLNDILKYIERQDGNKLNETTSSQVAKLGRANWILSGKIHQIKPQLIVTAQLTNIASDDIVQSYQIKANSDENLFTLVDKLTKNVKKDLSLPSSALNESDSPIAEVTTHSQNAYLHYLEGIDFYDRFYNEDAKRSFEMALNYDSTYAMAYYYLTTLDNTNRHDLISKAVEYSEKINIKEQLYIKSRAAAVAGDHNLAMDFLNKLIKQYPDEKEALYILGVFEYRYSGIKRAIDLFERVIEIDPLDTRTINELAYMYNYSGEYEKAIETADRYIKLSPNDANPYDTKAELFAKNGRLDEAIENYIKAVSIKPDFSQYQTLLSLGRLYVYLGNYAKARECFQEVIIKGDRYSRSLARTSMAAIPLYQGKFEEALRILMDGITVDKMELATAGDNGAESFKHYIKARIHVEKGELEIAAKELGEAIRVHNIVFPANRPAFRCMHAEVLAEGGDFDAAQKIVDILEKEYLAGEIAAQSGYWYAAGSIELVKGNYQIAVDALRKGMKASPNFDFGIILAKALTKSGNYNEAIHLYEHLLSNYTERFRLYQGIESVKAYYYLGVAYENTNQISKAKTQYEKFIGIWKNADTKFDSIEDAKKRLLQLNNGV